VWILCQDADQPGDDEILVRADSIVHLRLTHTRLTGTLSAGQHVALAVAPTDGKLPPDYNTALLTALGRAARQAAGATDDIIVTAHHERGYWHWASFAAGDLH
jgi:hypothetical protein